MKLKVWAFTFNITLTHLFSIHVIIQFLLREENMLGYSGLLGCSRVANEVFCIKLKFICACYGALND